MIEENKIMNLSDGQVLYNDLRDRIEEQSVPKGGTTGQILKKRSNSDYDAKWTADNSVRDVVIENISTVSNGVANIPRANDGTFGVVRIDRTKGIGISESGLDTIAANASAIKQQSDNYLPIVPNHQHEATFYGLARAAGDSTQIGSNNPVGTYTDEAKVAIQNMLGVDASGGVTDVQVNGTSVVADGVANVPIAGTNTLGVVRRKSTSTVSIDNDGYADTVRVSSISTIKNGSSQTQLLAPIWQHGIAFYGLAKAAGDSTQSASSNAVGQYTEAAKSAISTMLSGSVSVSGTTPAITALPGIRYVCGEVSTLDITLPASGCVDVTFVSGSTPTVLTVTPPTGVTVKWAGGFDPTSLEADTTYEINIADGLGVAGSWT